MMFKFFSSDHICSISCTRVWGSEPLLDLVQLFETLGERLVEVSRNFLEYVRITQRRHYTSLRSFDDAAVMTMQRAIYSFANSYYGVTFVVVIQFDAFRSYVDENIFELLRLFFIVLRMLIDIDIADVNSSEFIEHETLLDFDSIPSMLFDLNFRHVITLRLQGWLVQFWCNDFICMIRVEQHQHGGVFQRWTWDPGILYVWWDQFRVLWHCLRTSNFGKGGL